MTNILRFIPFLMHFMTLRESGHFPRGGDAFSVVRRLGTCCQRRMEFDFGPRHCPGDWVVSLCSTDSMFGKVALCIQGPQALTLLGATEEVPPSQWEVEPFSHLDIKVVRGDTRMTQRLATNSGIGFVLCVIGWHVQVGFPHQQA